MRRAGAQQCPCRQSGRTQGQRRQIGGKQQPAPRGAPVTGHRVAQPQGIGEHHAAVAVQPVVAGGQHILLAVHQRQQGVRHGHLALSAAARQALNGVQCRVARGHAFALEHAGCAEQLGQRAGALDDAVPIRVTDGTQGVDRVADTQVVGGLIGWLLHLESRDIGQGMLQPGLMARVMGRAAILETLRHLRQEHLGYAAALHPQQQLVERVQAGRANMVTTQVCDLARRLVGGHPFRQAAQVFHQHHTQRGRQRPQLAQVERAGFLVGGEEQHQQVFIEGSVGVRHKCPRNAINPRQPCQWRLLQDWQLAKVTARQALVNFP